MKKIVNLANAFTFSRIILGIIYFIIFLFIEYTSISNGTKLILMIISFIIFIIAIITDGLDGYFARKNDKVTDFGKHFDPLSDAFFFIIVFTTFLLSSQVKMPLYFYIIIVFREAFMHIFLRPYVKYRGLYLSANIFGKIKTFCQSMFSLIILGCLIFLQAISITVKNNNSIEIIQSSTTALKIIFYIFFLIISFLSLLSLFIYLILFFRKIKK